MLRSAARPVRLGPKKNSNSTKFQVFSSSVTVTVIPDSGCSEAARESEIKLEPERDHHDYHDT